MNVSVGFCIFSPYPSLKYYFSWKVTAVRVHAWMYLVHDEHIMQLKTPVNRERKDRACYRSPVIQWDDFLSTRALDKNWSRDAWRQLPKFANNSRTSSPSPWPQHHHQIWIYTQIPPHTHTMYFILSSFVQALFIHFSSNIFCYFSWWFSDTNLTWYLRAFSFFSYHLSSSLTIHFILLQFRFFQGHNDLFISIQFKDRDSQDPKPYYSSFTHAPWSPPRQSSPHYRENLAFQDEAIAR